MGARRWATGLLAAGLLAACGDDGAVTAPSETTVAPTTSTAATTTTAEPASTDTVFDPPCQESIRTTTATPGPAEADLARFGPLMVEPGLTITLPMVNASFNYVVPTAARVPGGVLIVASTDRSGYPEGGSLAPPGAVITVVDDDGGVRWVRCLDRTAMLASTAVTDGSALVTLDFDDTPTTHLLSLADGTIDDAALTSPASHARPWPRVDFSADAASVLQAVAENDTIVWQDRTILHPGREGAATRDAGDVVLVIGCVTDSSGSADGCNDEVIRGYRKSDGAVLWEHPGSYSLSVAGDGYALVIRHDPSGETPWAMIEANTGQEVLGQSFTGGVGFFGPCCGDTSRGVGRFGGVVVAFGGGRVEVYYPIDAGVTPHTVTIS